MKSAFGVAGLDGFKCSSRALGPCFDGDKEANSPSIHVHDGVDIEVESSR